MGTDTRTHGIGYRRDNNVTRPIETTDISAAWNVGTAPDADPVIWPTNTNIMIFDGDEAKIAALGTRGTLPVFFQQVRSQGFIPRVVCVRVDSTPKPNESFLESITNDINVVLGEVVDRNEAEEFDVLASPNIILVSKVYAGDDEYTRVIDQGDAGISGDWYREDNKIRWKAYDTVETVRRLTGTTDQLDYRDVGLLELVEVSQEETQFVVKAEGVLNYDCALVPGIGIEWFEEKIESITPGGENVGNGTVEPELSTSLVGEYVLTVTDVSTSGSEEWAVVDPNGSNIGTATVGFQFEHAQITIDITSGSVDYALNDVITITIIAANVPVSHTEYLATYTYGKRPAKNSNYQVDYHHLEFAKSEGEVVNRTKNSDLDYLGMRDIISVSSITLGDENFAETVDWTLEDDRIKWTKKAEVESVVKGAMTVLAIVQGSSNAGDGTASDILLGAEALVDDYVLTCTNISGGVGNEIWTLTAPNAAVLSTGITTGVEYTDTHITLTVDAGAVDYQVGDIITITLDGGTDTLVHSADFLVASEISQGLAFVEGVDWETTSDGFVHWLSDNKPADGSSYNITYEWGHRPFSESDYEVTYSFETGEYPNRGAIIGGYDMEGKALGLKCVTTAFDETGIRPGLITAFGFSHYPEVLAQMESLAEEVKGHVVASSPRTGKAAATMQQARDYRREWGSHRIYLGDGVWHKFWNSRTETVDVCPRDALTVGRIIANDYTNGIYWSPSNTLALGFLGNARPISDAEAEYYSDNDIFTIKQDVVGGYVLWGNRCTSRDPAIPFLCGNRMDDLIELSIVRALRIYNDNPLSIIFNNIGESVSQFLRSLAAKGQIYIGPHPFYIDPNKNNVADLAQGRVYCDFDVYFIPPAEHIIVTRHLDSELLKQAFENSTFVRGR